jgi:hypothetical protein
MDGYIALGLWFVAMFVTIEVAARLEKRRRR